MPHIFFELEGFEEKHLTFAGLFLLSNRLDTIATQILEELTAKQWFLLATLSTFQAPPSLSELAGRMGSSRQNVKQIALKLEQKGFVQINRDPLDSRVLRVQPAEGAEEYERLHQAENAAFIDRLYRDIPAEDLRAMLRVLVSLDSNLEQLQQERAESAE